MPAMRRPAPVSPTVGTPLLRLCRPNQTMRGRQMLRGERGRPTESFYQSKHEDEKSKLEQHVLPKHSEQMSVRMQIKPAIKRRPTFKKRSYSIEMPSYFGKGLATQTNPECTHKNNKDGENLNLTSNRILFHQGMSHCNDNEHYLHFSLLYYKLQVWNICPRLHLRVD